jgi:hypothetical protein
MMMGEGALGLDLSEISLAQSEREKAQKEINEAGRLQAEARKKFEDTVSGKLLPPQAPGEMP